MRSARSFQQQLYRDLTGQFVGLEVRSEWRAELVGAGAYSPRLDVCVGPFAYGSLRSGEEHSHAVSCHRPFIEHLHRATLQNLRGAGCGDMAVPFEDVIRFNMNARCFLAIEIENKVSRKHLMGGVINASALGRIGIAVGGSDRMLTALIRARRYLRFLMDVRKPGFDPINLMIVSPNQLRDAIRSALR